MIHKNTNIPITVIENRIETPDHRSIIFKRPNHFAYEPGDWIDIQMGHNVLRSGITYSLSSAPTEPYLMITFKDGLSEIKRALARLAKGETATIIQYGNGYKFTIMPHTSVVLIAGGVGVAPFRSMVKEKADTKANNNIALLYLNKTSDFLYASEFKNWAKSLTNFTMQNIVTQEINKKERTKLLAQLAMSTGRTFYIAGPEAMVESTEHSLIQLGVKVANIKIDSFAGY